MEQPDSTKHGPRLDEEIEHETKSLEQGAPVESRAQEGRVQQDAGGETPDEVLTTAGAEPELPHEQLEARSQLARVLRPSAFPGGRDDLLAAARAEQAPEPVLTVLERLPADASFPNVEAVWEALGYRGERRF